MQGAEPIQPGQGLRYGAPDLLRGVALVWMTLYHFGFDLSHFGYWTQDFKASPVWTLQRTAIVSLFLLCVGLGQAIAASQGVGWRRFGRRWAQIAVCALLVSAGSFAMFPHSFIYFGVLHGIALMWLIARLTTGWGRWLWLAGALALASPWVAQGVLAGPLAAWAQSFNGKALNWIGWITHKPFTEDYVVWWGMASGQWLLVHRTGWLALELGGAGRALTLLGRHSLPWYMLHQPVMMGALIALGWWWRP